VPAPETVVDLTQQGVRAAYLQWDFDTWPGAQIRDNEGDMNEKPIDNTLERLDVFCEALRNVADVGRDKGWPESLVSAVVEISQHIELLIGALSMTENDSGGLRDLIEEAAKRLPEEFSAFGEAIALDVKAILEELPADARSRQHQPLSVDDLMEDNVPSNS
jgi:hypothetical protein